MDAESEIELRVPPSTADRRRSSTSECLANAPGNTSIMQNPMLPLAMAGARHTQPGRVQNALAVALGGLFSNFLSSCWYPLYSELF
jgi:hypothetical protein